MNKRKQRTEDLRKRIMDVDRQDYVVNTIEQHNFDKLICSGVIVRCSLKTSESPVEAR